MIYEAVVVLAAVFLEVPAELLIEEPELESVVVVRVELEEPATRTVRLGAGQVEITPAPVFSGEISLSVEQRAALYDLVSAPWEVLAVVLLQEASEETGEALKAPKALPRPLSSLLRPGAGFAKASDRLEGLADDLPTSEYGRI